MKMEFEEGFEKLTGFAPLGWQTRLYSRFVADDPKGFPRRLDIPTGLGKTSILPIWLLARVDNPKLPRRLIYVVNRRTIVDQATRIADELKEKWKGKTLHVSTLRGEREDNGDWKRDPTAQAIVIGTVDLIGSRLLFNAYRGSRWHKSFEAGLVGQDSLIVHDEAHLTGPFDALLDRVVELQNLHTRELIARPMRVLSLSATTIPAKTEEDVFKLIDEDRQEALVKKRLESHKRMTIEELAGKKKLPERIAELAGEYKDSAVRVLVFVQSPADASAVATAIKKLIGKGGEKDRVEILTGTIRGYERDELVGKPVFKHFIERQQLTSGAVYLVCTSAGEIGVDFNADHATCDLSTLDSMIQRLGRVNRRGEQSDTRVRVVVEFKSKAGKLDPQRKVTRTLLESLHHDEQGYDVSPLSLRSLIEKPQYPKALTPEPQKIKLQSMTLDAWALTSIMEDWPIAAEVEQYLHGIVEENGRTEVAWRSELDWIADYSIDEDSLNRLFDQYPLKPRELLSDRTDRVAELLMKIRQTVPDPRILIVGKEASFIDWSKVRDES
jgi:CRISPR-associated endonuclease/helicase Cas3